VWIPFTVNEPTAVDAFSHGRNEPTMTNTAPATTIADHGEIEWAGPLRVTPLVVLISLLLPLSGWSTSDLLTNATTREGAVIKY
jgi:hypothetical protein